MVSSAECPIGIFDSGLGGLTVVKEVQRLLPSESLLYFGDTARLPYGEKSCETIVRYAREITDFLLQYRIKMLVVACNTASAYAVPTLRQTFTIPVLGVVEAGVEACLQASRSRRIGVIGTRATIRTGIYQKMLQERLPRSTITACACPLFVPIVEEQYNHSMAARLIAEDYLAPLKKANIDTLLLGCTHYPLLRPLIAEILGKEVTLVDSATACAEHIVQKLSEIGLAHTGGRGASRFFASDDPDRFRILGSRFLSHPISHVESVAESAILGEGQRAEAPLPTSSLRY